MKRSKTSSRHPDYFVGANGMPRLVEKVVRPAEYQSEMDSTISPTDPVKLNKCLYNIAVRKNRVASCRLANQNNRSNKIESDIVIRNQTGNKSNSSTNSSTGSSSTITNLSQPAPVAASSSSSSISVLNNWGGPVASPLTARVPDAHRCDGRAPITNALSIPRSRNYDYIRRSPRQAIGSNRVNCVTNDGSPMLLSSRQRWNVTTTADSNCIADSASSVMRQCRFSIAVQTTPPTTDNRLNYQRKYDRTIFGYNRLDQFVLPPLQI
ncbi:uncharacterized protein LOC131685163 [Topomyia yanbarensis]|uniref:uncharacterized protein LOC131685163 n=1 Tax=Topomyia yanbarensis TaxID=2498891 RepID=UPI00273C82FB|nr:uncharacterized protein LOC131685163 [Topomyia yanbarensis]XP_058824641.1 uncharacterized protein LOC131685163 [Topomyia yanbarensis]